MGDIRYKGLMMTMIMSIFGNTSLKVNWQGEIVSIQSRTKVWRYLTDNRTHYYLGYNLFVVGNSCDGKKQFSVAISVTKTVPVFERCLSPYKSWKLADDFCC